MYILAGLTCFVKKCSFIGQPDYLQGLYEVKSVRLCSICSMQCIHIESEQIMSTF